MDDKRKIIYYSVYNFVYDEYYVHGDYFHSDIENVVFNAIGFNPGYPNYDWFTESDGARDEFWYIYRKAIRDAKRDVNRAMERVLAEATNASSSSGVVITVFPKATPPSPVEHSLLAQALELNRQAGKYIGEFLAAPYNYARDLYHFGGIKETANWLLDDINIDDPALDVHLANMAAGTPLVHDDIIVFYVNYGIDALQALKHLKNISMDEALKIADKFLDLGTDVKWRDSSSGIQLIQHGVDDTGQIITRRVGIDVNPSSGHVQELGPHLNLQTQINNIPVKKGNMADPHIPINKNTVRDKDY